MFHRIQRARNPADTLIICDGQIALPPKTMVEIVGPHATGKSLLALQAIAQCILPRCCGGHASAAIVFDLALSFRPKFLIRALQNHIATCTATDERHVTDEGMEQAIRESLERLYVQRVDYKTNLAILAVCLQATVQQVHLPRLVVIDNLEIVYHYNRYTTHATDCAGSLTSYVKLKQTLRLLKRTHDLTLLIIRDQLAKPGVDPGLQPWLANVDYTILASCYGFEAVTVEHNESQQLQQHISEDWICVQLAFEASERDRTKPRSVVNGGRQILQVMDQHMLKVAFVEMEPSEQ
eukprot:Clim_evm10s33 gene=Clim_evmTU10s33